MMAYLGFFTSAIVSFFQFFINYIRTVYLAFKLDGPKAVPFLGNVLLLKDEEEMEAVGTHVYARHGPFMRIWVSILPVIFIYEPSHLRVILGTNKYSEKNIFYSILHNFIGEGLITNNGDKWKRNRRLIQPLFHVNILETFIEEFQNSAERFVDKLEGVTDTNIKISTFVNDCVLDILHNTVLGIPVDKDSPYRQGEVLLVTRLVRPWLLLEKIFKQTESADKEQQQKRSLHEYTKKVLSQKRSTNTFSKKCLMDMLVEIASNNKEFTDEDLINETVTFMLAGQDSVGAGIAFSLFYLAKYPDIQQKVIEELGTIGTITGMKELNEMKYLEQVIKETLRLAPSVPILARVLTEEVVLDGKTFPSGTNLLISPYITHRLPHVFPNPLEFNPDRFSPENLEKMHPYAFLPFSLGPRNCIGYKFAYLEMKSVLSAIVRRFELSLKPGYDSYQMKYRTTIRAKGGIWLQLKRRENVIR
ncbi:unnamed protein product [Phaedon cochleariae]|uniref:Cytochrome P450 n=1 Tax=Phaedon cochleariae TaxID=80249 RepID=A0A9N9SG62_PHACE|nr:unnamed protein product [Phaedon cochleariae]